MSLKKNFLYNINYQILILLIPLITAPYISRVLGADKLGIYSYTQAFASYFFLFSMLGLNNYGNRTIASFRDDKIELRKKFWEIYTFQFLFAIIVTLTYVIYCLNRMNENFIIYIIQFFYVASSIFDVNWACFGLEEFKFTTIRSTIIRIAMAIATFLFVKDKGDLPVYTFIIAFGNFLSAIIVFPYLIKRIPFFKPSFNGVVSHIKPNLILFLPVIAVSLYNIMDKLMLGYFSTKKEVGFYTYAESITQIPNTLILALGNVIMPRAANLYAKNDIKNVGILMDKVMLFATLMSSAMAFGLATVAPIFAPMFFGEEFIRTGVFIKILSPIVIFKGWAGVLRTQYIIPKGRDKIYILSLTSGAIVNLIINYLLISKYNGIGAIIGTILAELVVCLVQFYYVQKEINIKVYIKQGFIFIILGLIMYISIKPLSQLEFSPLIIIIVQIILGVIIYLSLSLIYILRISKIESNKKDVMQIINKFIK